MGSAVDGVRTRCMRITTMSTSRLLCMILRAHITAAAWRTVKSKQFYFWYVSGQIKSVTDSHIAILLRRYGIYCLTIIRYICSPDVSANSNSHFDCVRACYLFIVFETNYSYWNGCAVLTSLNLYICAKFVRYRAFIITNIMFALKPISKLGTKTN